MRPACAPCLLRFGSLVLNPTLGLQIAMSDVGGKRPLPGDDDFVYSWDTPKNKVAGISPNETEEEKQAREIREKALEEEEHAKDHAWNVRQLRKFTHPEPGTPDSDSPVGGYSPSPSPPSSPT